MDVLYLVLYIVAAVCFALAVFGYSPATTAGDNRRSFNLVAAGLLAWVLVPLLVHVQTL